MTKYPKVGPCDRASYCSHQHYVIEGKETAMTMLCRLIGHRYKIKKLGGLLCSRCRTFRPYGDHNV